MKNTMKQARDGFTLVELLVVISIIGFMSGMFLVAYRGASQESNIQKTRSTVQKISEVLNARMDEYINYPIALRTATSALPPNVVSWDGSKETVSVLRERGRLLVLRDLIRMEMPDHPDDLKYTTFWMSSAAVSASYPTNLPRSVPTGLGTTPVLASPGFQISAPLTSRTRALIARLSKVSPVGPIDRWDAFNANEELLFLIVEASDLNGTSAIELFGKSEIGDTDGDGLNEFIDAYGSPIRWIRWPAGFSGASRFYPDMLDPSLVSGGRLLINSEPLDSLGTDPGWATTLQKPGTGLSPLVISAGTDRKFGIRFREINRYSVATPPTRVGVFAGIDSYSSAEAPWADSPPKYGLIGFTDPWYPRDPSTTGTRMGETVIGAVSDLENGQPVGPRNAGDNISNFEGSAVSL